MSATTQSALEVFEVFVDGCKHYANATDLGAAMDLARWCHARGYCYDLPAAPTYHATHPLRASGGVVNETPQTGTTSTVNSPKERNFDSPLSRKKAADDDAAGTPGMTPAEERRLARGAVKRHAKDPDDRSLFERMLGLGDKP